MVEMMYYEKGSVIFEEGAWELSMYEILNGKIGIYNNYGAENEVLLTELTVGQYFGELAVIDTLPRSATAVALEDSEVILVKNSEFDDYLTRNPEKLLDIFQGLCSRLQELSTDYTDACKTITEYVQAEDKKKEGTFAGKVKKLLSFFYAYSEFTKKQYSFVDDNNYVYF